MPRAGTRANIFFEFVERINNYQGYGENNALFRIAAQKNYLKIK